MGDREQDSGEASSFQQVNPAASMSNTNIAPGFGVAGRDTDSLYEAVAVCLMTFSATSIAIRMIAYPGCCIFFQ
jgi:hypothetical protein